MLHTIQNQYFTVTASEMGAELQSILAADGTEYLWQGDPAFWSGRSPVLFPFVGRLNGKKYYLDGQEYETKIHGFASECTFTLEKKTETEMVFLLEDNEATYKQFPRHFAFRVIYALDGKELTMAFQIENRDSRILYYGVGGHPGFRVPLVPGKAFEDYRLRFSEKGTPDQFLLSPAYFLSGETAPYVLENNDSIPLRHSLFDGDAIVLKNTSQQIVLETDGDPHKVTVSYPQMPYLGMWHAVKKPAPYVCIEPWGTLPPVQDEVTHLEQRKDFFRLAPGEVHNNIMTIRCDF